MELKRPHTTEVLNRIVPPLTIWAISRILRTDSVSGAVDRVDRRIESRRRRAVRSLSRVRRNATANPVWLIGGMVAIVAGVAMIVKAARD